MEDLHGGRQQTAGPEAKKGKGMQKSELQVHYEGSPGRSVPLHLETGLGKNKAW